MPSSRVSSAFLGASVFVCGISLEPTAAAQVMRKTASEIIHDQTLKQGLEQRRGSSRSGDSSSSGATSQNEEGQCVTAAQKQAACAKLSAIVDGTSGDSNPRGAIRDILASGGPAPFCFTSAHNDIYRLHKWAGMCGLDGLGKIDRLENPGPQNRSTEARSGAGSGTSSRTRYTTPSSPSAPATPPEKVATWPTPLPAEKLAEIRAAQEKYARDEERERRNWERRIASYIDDDVRNAPKQVERNRKQGLSPAQAREKCASGDQSACAAANAMASTRAEALASYEALCRNAKDRPACEHAERAARAFKDWAAHRRVVQFVCEWVKDASYCAVMASFHLDSPAWRAAWAWDKSSASKEQGRAFALAACQRQGQQTWQQGCADLVGAARDGVGGKKGLTYDEKTAVMSACAEGRMGADDCVAATPLLPSLDKATLAIISTPATEREPSWPTPLPADKAAETLAADEKYARDQDKERTSAEPTVAAGIARENARAAAAIARHQRAGLTRDKALEKCAAGEADACDAAIEMSGTPAESASAYEARCRALEDRGRCPSAEAVARALKQWPAHRRVVETLCEARKDPNACALVAKFHLGSPSWRSAWSWDRTDVSKERGRRAALAACAGRGRIETACAELVSAAKDGIGGKKGLTYDEKDAVMSACASGRLGTRECESAAPMLPRMPEDVAKRRVLDALGSAPSSPSPKDDGKRSSPSAR